eukprot:1160526-Pelagomonas_calceolata.AAC.17
MSLNNPSPACKRYTSSCKCPRKEEGVIGLDSGVEESGPSCSAKLQQSFLIPYMLSAERLLSTGTLLYQYIRVPL